MLRLVVGLYCLLAHRKPTGVCSRAAPPTARVNGWPELAMYSPRLFGIRRRSSRNVQAAHCPPLRGSSSGSSGFQGWRRSSVSDRSTLARSSQDLIAHSIRRFFVGTGRRSSLEFDELRTGFRIHLRLQFFPIEAFRFAATPQASGIFFPQRFRRAVPKWKHDRRLVLSASAPSSCWTGLVPTLGAVTGRP